MNVRNVFTSSTLYTQQVGRPFCCPSILCGISNQLRNIQTLPPALCFPDTFGVQYDWRTIPAEEALLPKRAKATTRKHSAQYEKSSIAREDVHQSDNSENGSEVSSPSPSKQDAKSPAQALSPREVYVTASPATREHNLHRDRNAILTRVSVQWI